MDYFFSVIRLVPDPIKFEPINIGVAVVSADGSEGDLLFNRRFKTRLASVKKGYPAEALVTALDDLRFHLGLDVQQRLGEKPLRGQGFGEERLRLASQYFENQLQLSEPQRYQADSVGDATRVLYTRYVSSRLPSKGVRREMTAAEMRSRIWQVIRDWQDDNIVIDRSRWLRGPETKARHPADYIIRNGTAKAAFFALATADPDRPATHLYRDSLPTIAKDMGPSFVAYAVLPDLDEDSLEEVRDFVSETRILLDEYEQVRTVFLRHVADLRDEIISRLI